MIYLYNVFFDRMCGPKTEKTILDYRPFGFPFDRKNDFEIYKEEWVQMS